MNIQSVHQATDSFCCTRSVQCCTRPIRHGTLFPFPVLAPFLHLRANGCCCAVQARLCHKCCRHIIGLGPYLLSMTTLPSALAAVSGFASFHFCFAPSISAPFAICHWIPLKPAPLLPLDDNSSIAWSMRTLVQYIKPNTWPGKLQSSLLGYSPGFTKTATGDTDVPSHHSHAERSQLLFHSSHLSPNLASALSGLRDSQLHHFHL